MPDALAKVLGQPIAGPRRQVEKAIRGAILSGELQVGERLPAEAELARQFEVSRTTIREALQSLWAEGLIRKIPGAGGGSFVESIDHRSLERAMQQSLNRLLQLGTLLPDEVNLVRELLELPAVRLAAVNRSDADLARLNANTAARRKVAATDPQAAELDSEFHRLVAEASGNRVLAALIAALHTESSPDAQAEDSEQVNDLTVRHHQEIADAIAVQDADEAESLAIAHLSVIRSHPAA
ncbi:MAG TPA: FCD domain-containing protein [Streptosporangiaceae bacterium]|nr:FCD domain-containing protein [Streptosporangiaceae bacterium]